MFMSFCGRYARQVKEFFAFVKKKQEASPSETEGGGKLVLPKESGLWVPNNGHFPEAALKSLDFQKAMSFFSG